MIPGYTNMSIDPLKLWEYLKACEDHGVRYGFGSKCPEALIGKLPIKFKEIDCSGFVRTTLAYASGGSVRIVDGSYNQGEWLKAHGYKITDRENCALNDGHIRICVHHPDVLDETGHVWVCQNGRTLESAGGRGPCSRPWNVMLSRGHRLDQLATLTFAVL